MMVRRIVGMVGQVDERPRDDLADQREVFFAGVPFEYGQGLFSLGMRGPCGPLGLSLLARRGEVSIRLAGVEPGDQHERFALLLKLAHGAGLALQDEPGGLRFGDQHHCASGV
jgi:hypothetical protein